MKCLICGRIEDQTHIVQTHGIPLCCKHHHQFRTKGHFSETSIYSPNDYIIHEDYAEILLRNKKNKHIASALIDLDDVEKCKLHKWHLKDKLKYVCCSIGKKNISLHRYILEYCGNKDIDHININPLDNRKSNLRIVTRSENRVNTKKSKEKCIYLTKSNKWRLKIYRYNKFVFDKVYETKNEAIQAKEAFLKEFNKEYNRAV